MTQNTQNDNKFDVFLEQLEAKERKERRRRIMVLLPLVLIMGIMAFWLIMPQAPATDSNSQRMSVTRTYHANELTMNKVMNLFEVDNSEFVLDHPLFGLDTIRSPREYKQLIKLVSQAEKDRQAIDNLRVSDSIRVAAEGTLEVFEVDVVGERVVGNVLIFKIENYDPEVKYLLDFGNGERRNIDKKTTYAYPFSGNFVMQLFASSPEKGASVYTKKYLIKTPDMQMDSVRSSYSVYEEGYSMGAGDSLTFALRR